MLPFSKPEAQDGVGAACIDFQPWWRQQFSVGFYFHNRVRSRPWSQHIGPDADLWYFRGPRHQQREAKQSGTDGCQTPERENRVLLSPKSPLWQAGCWGNRTKCPAMDARLLCSQGSQAPLSFGSCSFRNAWLLPLV